MDTRTGQVVNLSETDQELASLELAAWKAGLLKAQPRYVPIKNDSTPVRPKRKKLIRSYKEFCN